MALLQAKVGVECIGVHHKVQKDVHNARYLPKEPRCIPQVSGGSTQVSQKQVKLFKTRLVDEVLKIGSYGPNFTFKSDGGNLIFDPLPSQLQNVKLASSKKFSLQNTIYIHHR